MKSGYRVGIVRMVGIDTAVALIIALLICTLTGDPFLRDFWICLIYSNVIGGLSHLVIPATWPAFASLKPPLPWIVRGGVMLLNALVGTLISIALCMELGLYARDNYWHKFLDNVSFVLLMALIIGLAITVYESSRARLVQTTLELRTRELERERAMKLATEARLASLESRVHPHFLFNALNSISALIRRDPERAESLVERMAALLRFSLDAQHGGLVPLSREMKIVRDYLEIERARFGSRLRYRLDVPAEFDDLRVPPLAVQTLVENSVKYVISASLNGGEIAVRAEERGGTLAIEVADSGPGFEADSAPSGHGIENVRERLAALFGERAALTSGRTADRAFVRITVPQGESTRTPVPA